MDDEVRGDYAPACPHPSICNYYGRILMNEPCPPAKLSKEAMVRRIGVLVLTIMALVSFLAAARDVLLWKFPAFVGRTGCVILLSLSFGVWQTIRKIRIFILIMRTTFEQGRPCGRTVHPHGPALFEVGPHVLKKAVIPADMGPVHRFHYAVMA